MGLAATFFGLVLVFMMAWEAFETIVLPRTVSRKLRITSLYFSAVWKLGAVPSRMLSRRPSAREAAMAVLGPLSLILLLAMWSVGLIFGFALIQTGIGTPWSGGAQGLGVSLYASASTFFTLGYGDVVALDSTGRAISMVEVAVGFGMLALVISYVPVLYQAFSARERVSLLLDARAGSPPVAAELLAFYDDDLEGLRLLFAEFERWGATLLETYLSYPVLTLYRSQHEQLSWIASTTCICDACAMVQAGYQDDSAGMKALQRQAQLTYAMMRHLVVDVAFIIQKEPVEPSAPRLDEDRWRSMIQLLQAAGAPVCTQEDSWERLEKLRRNYEPYVYGLAVGVFLEMPPWTRVAEQPASWETTAWDKEKHF